MRITFRPAVIADHERFTRFFAELEIDDPVPDQGPWASTMMPYSAFLEVDGACVGYAMFKAGSGTGHVYHLVVDPSRRGEGHGKRLMEQVAERLRSEGCSRWCLNVKEENTPARRLYAHFGMENDYESSALRLTWSQASTLDDTERGCVVRDLSPADDTRLEARFQLVPGQIAFSRSKPNTVQLGIGAEHAPTLEGFASFDPNFPGAFPFRVARPSLARPLLLALQSHADPSLDSCPDAWRSHGLQVVVENDATLTRVLRAAGASLALHFLHYAGEIP